MFASRTRVHCLRLAALAALLAGATACTPPPSYHDFSFGGQPAPGAGYLLERGDGAALYAVGLWQPGASRLWAAVQDRGEGEALVLSGVFKLVGQQPYDVPVVVIASAGDARLPGEERYLPLAELLQAPAITGLSVARIDDGRATWLCGVAQGGWYWALAEELRPEPGFGSFATGLVRLNDDGTLAASLGAAPAGALLVEAKREDAVAVQPLRIGLEGDGPLGDGSLHGRLAQQLAALGLRSTVQPVASVDTALTAGAIDLGLRLDEGGDVLVEARPEWLPPTAPRSWQGFGRLSLLRGQLSLPTAARHEAVGELILALAAAEQPSSVLTAYLFERSLGHGLSFNGSTRAATLRATELVAAAGYAQLARTRLAALDDGSEGFAADAARYRARILHAALLHGRATAEEVSAAYREALYAYDAIDFAVGAGDTAVQYASFLDATGQASAAADLYLAAQQTFARAGFAETALSLNLRALVARTRAGLTEQDEKALSAALLLRTELASEPAELAYVQAWIAALANDTEILAPALAAAQAAATELPWLTPLVATGEARLETLTARGTQATETLIEAARLAPTQQDWRLVAWIGVRLDAALGATPSPAQALRAAAVLGAAYRDGAAELSEPEAVVALLTRLCSVSVSAEELATREATEACVLALDHALQNESAAIEPLLATLTSRVGELAVRSARTASRPTPEADALTDDSGAPEPADDDEALWLYERLFVLFDRWSTTDLPRRAAALTALGRELPGLLAALDREDEAVLRLGKLIFALDGSGKARAGAESFELRVLRARARAADGELESAKTELDELEAVAANDAERRRVRAGRVTVLVRTEELAAALALIEAEREPSLGLLVLRASLRARLAAEAVDEARP